MTEDGPVTVETLRDLEERLDAQVGRRPTELLHDPVVVQAARERHAGVDLSRMDAAVERPEWRHVAVRVGLLWKLRLRLDRPAAEELAVRASGYFDDEYGCDTLAFWNAALREEWRDRHGSTTRWDRAARREGVRAIGKVIL